MMAKRRNRHPALRLRQASQPVRTQAPLSEQRKEEIREIVREVLTEERQGLYLQELKEFIASGVAWQEIQEAIRHHLGLPDRWAWVRELMEEAEDEPGPM